MSAWVPLLSAVAGGIVTGVLALLGVKLSAERASENVAKTVQAARESNDAAIRGAGENVVAGIKKDLDIARREAEARDRQHWWQRFTECMEMALDPREVRRTAGVSMLTKLADSPLAGPEERELLRAIGNQIFGPVAREATTDDED